MAKHEDTFRNFMGLTTKKEIVWSHGATFRQPDSWSCGYRVMHGMVAYLKAMENEIFLQPDNLSPTLSATEEDIIQVKERWAPSFLPTLGGGYVSSPTVYSSSLNGNWTPPGTITFDHSPKGSSPATGHPTRS